MTAMCHLPFTRGKPSGILPTFFFFFWCWVLYSGPHACRAGFKPLSSWFLPPEITGVSHRRWLVNFLNWFSLNQNLRPME
jgi:hypothetical protein